MAYSFPTDVRQLVQAQMASGKFASEDELLREALLTLSEEDADLTAIRAALDELADGDDGLPLDEAFVSIRRQSSA
jgi:Arc/MetJ-type ribon-helix-helix transcriptional regulator